MERHLSSVECMLVRETMVRQEKMYREQVQALHYLYEVQKTLMEERISKNSQLQDHQFFPVKPPEKERVKRNFDLEKLPDEYEEVEEKVADVKPRLIDLNTNCNGDADVELVLNCGSHSKRPRYGNHEDVQDVKMASLQSQDFLTGLNSQFQFPNGAKNQLHWLQEDSRKLEFNAWNTLKHNPVSLFHHSWLPQEPSQTPPPRLWSTTSGLGLGSLDGNANAAAPWYNQQLSTATHPWQASGAAYFSGATYSPFITPPNGLLNGFPNGVSASTITSTKTPYRSSPETTSTDLGVYLQQQQRLKNGGQQHRNGYSNTLLDSLVARELTEGYSAGLLGDRNFFRDPHTHTHTSKACNLETRFLTLASEAQQDYWSQVGASKPNANAWSDAQVELSLVPTRAEDDEEAVKNSASILMSLSQDKWFCQSKENSPPLLKKSVEWFADAMLDEQEKSKDKCGEVDEFEMAYLELQACKFDEYAPIRVDAVLETALSPRNKTASGRPKRVGKKQRDFRNDTLPSITSLSRQEITEDFQIMSGLMRSTREQHHQLTESTVGAGGGSQSRRGSKSCNGKQGGSTGITLEVNKAGTGGTGTASGGSLPWVVSWGESTRRKRQQRQRSAALPPLSKKLTVLNSSTVTTRARR